MRRYFKFAFPAAVLLSILLCGSCTAQTGKPQTESKINSVNPSFTEAESPSSQLFPIQTDTGTQTTMRSPDSETHPEQPSATETEGSSSQSSPVQTDSDAQTATPSESKPVSVPADPVETTESSELKTAKGYAITVLDGVTYIGGILIANKTYSLPETYAPGGIVSECYQAFLQMSKDAAKDGIQLVIRSDFRSYYDQRYIYAGYVQKDGAAAADRYSARAGHSEHQSGLALDLNSLEYSFGETPEGKWLASHAHLYGFIIRYPEGKEEITGYRYEPWHVRYLGEIAKDVYESGLCLEEYLGITSSYENCPLCNAETNK